MLKDAFSDKFKKSPTFRHSSCANRDWCTMNLSVDLTAAVQRAVENAQRRDVTLVTFLTALSVIGVLVNSVLLDVYLHTRRRVVSTYFITAVATIDLLISGVVMPLRIVQVVTVIPPEVCAICLSLGYGCIGVSIMLFFCITFDRYQCVCLLQRPLITPQNLHLVGSWAAVSALYAGVVAPIYLRGEITVLDGVTNHGNASGHALRKVTLLMRPGHACYSTSLLSHPRRVWDERYIVQFVFAVCCSSLILLVLVLYVFMFLKLRQKDQFRLQFLSYQRNSPRELTARPCLDINDLPRLKSASNGQYLHESDRHSTSCALSSASKHSQPTLKSNTDKENDHPLGAKTDKLQPGKKLLSDDRALNVDSIQAVTKKTMPISQSLKRSVSCLYLRDLRKFRRRKCGTVEPLQCDKKAQEKGLQIKQNKGSELKTCNRIIKCATKISAKKSTEVDHEPQKIKIIRNHPLATLSCFRNHHQKEELEYISLDAFSSKLASDTDSIQSEPELQSQRLNTKFIEEIRVCPNVGIPENVQKNSDYSILTAQPSSLPTEPIPRSRSSSCPDIGSSAKYSRFKNLVRTGEEENSCPSEAKTVKTLDSESCTAQDKAVQVKSNPEVNVSAKPVSEILSKNCKFQYFTKQQKNDVPVNCEVSDSKIRKKLTSSNTCKNSLTLEQEKMGVSASTLTKRQQTSKTAHNVVHLPKGTYLSDKNAAESKLVTTNLTVLRDGQNADSSKLAQLQGDQPRVREQQHKTPVGCCGFWACSLSTRVTARVGLLTLAYCLWWMPFYLTELGLVSYDTLMPEMFFMANVMNPLLHLMTSQVFRHQLRARFKVYKARFVARFHRQSSKV